MSSLHFEIEKTYNPSISLSIHLSAVTGKQVSYRSDNRTGY